MNLCEPPETPDDQAPTISNLLVTRTFCSLQDDKTLKCWGRNRGGLLGLGDESWARVDEARGDDANGDLPPRPSRACAAISLLSDPAPREQRWGRIFLWWTWGLGGRLWRSAWASFIPASSW